MPLCSVFVLAVVCEDSGHTQRMQNALVEKESLVGEILNFDVVCIP